MTRAQVDATGFLTDLASAKGALGDVLGRAVTGLASLGQTVVRANASSGTHPPGQPRVGGPGPNVVTGAYRRSIAVTASQTGTSITADVSTNAVQGPRLEFGFIGRDSAGRYYRQPPYPHFGPAADQMEGMVDDAADAAAGRIASMLGGGGG